MVGGVDDKTYLHCLHRKRSGTRSNPIFFEILH